MFILNALIGASCDCSEVFAKQMAYTPATRKALTAKDAKHTAKRKKALRTIGSQRCAMLPANTRREAYIAFGGGFWAWCPKATTRSISDCRLSFMKLCYWSNPNTNRTNIWYVRLCECFDYVRETTTQSKPTFDSFAYVPASIAWGSIPCLASLTCRSIPSLIMSWSYPLVPKHRCGRSVP